MTQIPEPLQLSVNEQLMSQMNPNINIINQVNFPQMMPPQLNMPINGNFQMGIPVQMNNNPHPTDQSK